MAQNYQKEIEPVLYDSSGLKMLKWGNLPPNQLLFNMHWHERMELILVHSGYFHFRIRNHETTLCAGQLAIIPPGQLHYGMSGNSPVSMSNIMFDINSFYNRLPVTKRFLKPISEQKVHFSPQTEHPEIIAHVKSLLDDATSNDPLNLLSKTGKFYELIALLYKHCLIEDESDFTPHNQFQNVLDYMNKHYYEDISSADLSKRFGYSEGYFCRHFKLITGLSPMIYIRILRLEKAMELLQNEHLSFTEIAMRCGFSNANYFTRCFKSHFNMTPSEYLQQQKESR